MNVDIRGLGIELSSMPNQPSISIRLQYQSHCLDVDKIERWNQNSWGIPIHVWMSTPWHLILSTPREAGEELGTDDPILEIEKGADQLK